jgi:hypothetical protein
MAKKSRKLDYTPARFEKADRAGQSGKRKRIGVNGRPEVRDVQAGNSRPYPIPRMPRLFIVGFTLMLWLAWQRRPFTGNAMLLEALQALTPDR